MKRFWIFVILVCVLGGGVLPASGQDDTCPVIVRTAIDATESACAGLGRNQVCYGNNLIELTPQEGITALTFEQTGDIVNIVDVETLRLNPLDEATGTWGVAVMKIQANIPDTMPGQNVTFVLFGDVEIENAGSAEAPVVEEETPPVTVEVVASNQVNLRSGPSTDHSVVTGFTGTIQADGRTEDGDWLRVLLPGQADYLWVAASVVTINGDVMTLAVREATAGGAAGARIVVDTIGEINVYDDPRGSVQRGSMQGTSDADGRTEDGVWLRTFWANVGHVWYRAADVTPRGSIDSLPVIDTSIPYGPMQAFYFRAGVGESPCEEAPQSGLLIQTPQGVGEVRLSMNGLEFGLGTRFFVRVAEDGRTVVTTRPPDDPPQLIGSVLQGHVSLPNGHSLYSGQSQVFGMTDDGIFAPLGNPWDHNPAEFNNLPHSLLSEPYTPPQRVAYDAWGWPVVANHYVADWGKLNDQVAVTFHSAGGDNTQWDPWIPGLWDAGFDVWSVDMPGHGQTGGERDWNAWTSVANETVSYLTETYGYTGGVFFGASIGANVALHACAAAPGWCQGVVAYSPGLDYMGVTTPDVIGAFDAPVYIAAGAQDRHGGDASTAMALSEIGGSHVTTQIYDSEKHGAYLGHSYGPWTDLAPWWAQNIGELPNGK